MFDSLKKVEGSELAAYIHKKRILFKIGSQITTNQLVRELSDSYAEMDDSLKYNTDYGKVREYCKEYLHPAINPTYVNIGRGVAVRDVIYFISEGEPMLPDGFFESLLFIEENRLVDRVRAEVTKLPTAEELHRKKMEEVKQKALAEDLAKLQKQLEEAKQWLGQCPKVQKASYEQKVKNIEATIERVKGGELLSSIRWT